MSLSRLIYITRDLEALSHRKQVKAAIKGGVKHIQFRTKELSNKEALKEAREIQDLCIEDDVFFTVNDNLDIALQVEADAIHLGLSDLPISQARSLMGNQSMLIGGTCNTLADIMQRIEDGADYIGLGPFQYTKTKEQLSPILEEKGYVSIISQMKTLQKSIPVFAIGGIGMSDISSLFRTGIHGIAMASVFGKEEEEIQMNIKQARTEIERIGFEL